MDDLERFSFFIAEKLGKFQEDVLQHMTIREARGWMEYLEDPQGKKSTDMSKLMQHLQGRKNGQG